MPASGNARYLDDLDPEHNVHGCPGPLASADADAGIADPHIPCTGTLRTASLGRHGGNQDVPPAIIHDCPRSHLRCPLARAYEHHCLELEAAALGADQRIRVDELLAGIAITRRLNATYLPGHTVQVIPTEAVAHARALISATRDYMDLHDGMTSWLGADGHLAYVDLRLRIELPKMRTRLGAGRA